MHRWNWAALAGPLMGLALLACAQTQPAAVLPPGDDTPYLSTSTGLRYYDIKVGEGAAAAPGRRVWVHYTGWLLDGTKFDSSVDRGRPFNFILGAHRVIRGWDEGVATMKVGGKRKLVIPPELGYGKKGAGKDIPPNATLIFEVELVGVE